MRGFASQTKPDLGSGHFPSKEQHVDVAAGVLGESTARTWSCWADFHHLLLCCCAQHLLASLCRHPTTETGQSWPLLCCLFPHKCWKIDGRRVWLELSPKIFIYCVEEYFLTCPCSTEGSLQHRIPCINHITLAFLRVPEQRMLPADKGGRISTC